MPQGKGTYGSQVGRPSKKRTSYVNDNKWYDTVSSASNRYSDLSEGQGGEESDTKRGRVIVESSFTGSEYRKHLDSRKDRGSPSWEKESASLNKAMDYGRANAPSSNTPPRNPGYLWEKARKSSKPSSFETPYFQNPSNRQKGNMATKRRRPSEEEDDLTKEKVMQSEPSGLGKTLLTSKPTEEDTSDEKQRKSSFYKPVY